jgi:hypothetical protein
MRLSTAKVLDAELQSFRLGDLTEGKVFVQVAGQSGRPQHQVVTFILGGVLVVPVHRRTVVMELVCWDRAAWRFSHRSRVHTRTVALAPGDIQARLAAKLAAEHHHGAAERSQTRGLRRSLEEDGVLAYLPGH